MTAPQAVGISLRQELEPFITREISGIAAIDTAISHTSAPDYVVMFQDAKNGKQANVEQMATLVRMHGDSPDESGGIRKTLTRTQAAISSRLSTTMTLRAMRLSEIELVKLYSDALNRSDGLVRRALLKVLGRAMVHAHLLTAHLAKRTGSKADANLLPAPLDDYFVGAEPRACMRCHLDRPGAAGALERRDPHPYTYICAACHDEVLGEFTPDLVVQFDRWPRAVREAKVIQHAIGHVSKLNAIGRVLYPLAGLEPDLPTPAAERALIVPAMTPTPGPAPGERRGVVEIDTAEGQEGEYVRELFSPPQTWPHW
jgi:uncharacterized protein DUF2383